MLSGRAEERMQDVERKMRPVPSVEAELITRVINGRENVRSPAWCADNGGWSVIMVACRVARAEMLT